MTPLLLFSRFRILMLSTAFQLHDFFHDCDRLRLHSLQVSSSKCSFSRARSSTVSSEWWWEWWERRSPLHAYSLARPTDEGRDEIRAAKSSSVMMLFFYIFNCLRVQFEWKFWSIFSIGNQDGIKTIPMNLILKSCWNTSQTHIWKNSGMRWIRRIARTIHECKFRVCAISGSPLATAGTQQPTRTGWWRWAWISSLIFDLWPHLSCAT